MVWYDVVVLMILFFTGWRGAQRGLVTQLAWVAAVVLSFKFADSLAPSLIPHISVGEPNNPVRHWIAMFILFVGFSVGSFLIARTIDSSLHKAKLKELDRFFGGIIGLVFGSCVVLFVTFFTSVWEPTRSAVLESRFGVISCKILDTIKPLTPEHFHEYFVKYQERLPHDQHGDLGHGTTTIPEEFGGGDSTSGGFNLPDLIGGLSGDAQSGNSGSSGLAGMSNGPTLDELMQTLPRSLREEFGLTIEERWNAATAQQKQKLISELNRSFDAEMPAKLNNFLSSIGSSSGGQGAATQRTDFRSMLNEIGDIYRDRNQIVRRTQEHLAGIPVRVQEAVLRDWYADVTMQPSDPDPLTGLQTRLDERILRQLSRARVPLTDLSFELRQRLNRSRQ